MNKKIQFPQQIRLNMETPVAPQSAQYTQFCNMLEIRSIHPNIIRLQPFFIAE